MFYDEDKLVILDTCDLFYFSGHPNSVQQLTFRSKPAIQLILINNHKSIWTKIH